MHSYPKPPTHVGADPHPFRHASVSVGGSVLACLVPADGTASPVVCTVALLVKANDE